ncbi:MAG: DUF2306 domain-containing protein [Acidobacteriaceae bacterium]|nr:DUF2306 domain-containing protein [Acidobacteriaceae bacterium]
MRATEAVKRRPYKALWTAVFLLAAIGVAAAIRRLIVLATGPGTGYSAGVDAGFARHPLLTLVHILPGMLFMFLAPLQFMTRIRAKAPRIHRWTGRALVCLGLVIGVSALLMSFRMAIGGINEMAATVLFDVLFLFCLLRGYAAVRRRDFVHHREWMIRMFGIALGIATTRPVMGFFFATSRLTHLTPHEFFGTAFWIGFTLSLIAAESWVNYTRPETRDSSVNAPHGENALMSAQKTR